VRLHHTYPSGRFGLVAKTGRRTIARGSLSAKVTRRGIQLLRRGRRLSVALTFAPNDGRAIVAARTVTLRR
jgi:hypothetical protein